MKKGYKGSWRVGLILPPILSLFLSGCINIVPVPRMGEIAEAKALAKILKNLVGDARDQLIQEHKVAQELKITLEESPQVEPPVFREKFNSYIDHLIAIRNKRREIMETVRQGLWDSPMVFVIQQDAVHTLQRELTRTQSWIEMAQNIRLRSDLGRQKDFPEFALLSHELDTFLSETGEDPLGNQLRSLQEEFRFGEAEIRRSWPLSVVQGRSSLDF